MDSPETLRLSAYIPPPSPFYAGRQMANQWKTSSRYITERKAPRDVPYEFTPGSTSAGFRAANLEATALPYEPSKVRATATWPPPFPAELQRPRSAAVPLQLFGGAHLKRHVIAPGLGGIEPRMG